MKLNKLFMRFMKEQGVFLSKETKGVIEFVNDFDEVLMPFNSFRWDTTTQGHNYWYSKSLKWMINVFENFDAIDTEDKEKYRLTMCALVDNAYELIKYYCLDNATEEDLKAIEGFSELKEIHDRKNKELEEERSKTITFTQKGDDGMWVATTTITTTTA